MFLSSLDFCCCKSRCSFKAMFSSKTNWEWRFTCSLKNKLRNWMNRTIKNKIIYHSLKRESLNDIPFNRWWGNFSNFSCNWIFSFAKILSFSFSSSIFLFQNWKQLRLTNKFFKKVIFEFRYWSIKQYLLEISICNTKSGWHFQL